MIVEMSSVDDNYDIGVDLDSILSGNSESSLSSTSNIESNNYIDDMGIIENDYIPENTGGNTEEISDSSDDIIDF